MSTAVRWIERVWVQSAAGRRPVAFESTSMDPVQVSTAQAVCEPLTCQGFILQHSDLQLACWQLQRKQWVWVYTVLYVFTCSCRFVYVWLTLRSHYSHYHALLLFSIKTEMTLEHLKCIYLPGLNLFLIIISSSIDIVSGKLYCLRFDPTHWEAFHNRATIEIRLITNTAFFSALRQS